MIASIHELLKLFQVVNLNRFTLVNLNRFQVVSLNRSEVVNFIGFCNVGEIIKVDKSIVKVPVGVKSNGELTNSKFVAVTSASSGTSISNEFIDDELIVTVNSLL